MARVIPRTARTFEMPGIRLARAAAARRRLRQRVAAAGRPAWLAVAGATRRADVAVLGGRLPQRSFRRLIVFMAAAAAMIVVCAPQALWAGESGGVGQSPLDRELFGPEARPAVPSGSGGIEGSSRPWAERLRRELGAAAQSEDDPLWLRAVVRMEDAAGALRAGRVAQAAEQQRAAAALWDELLASARRSQSSGGAANAATTPNGASQPADGQRAGSRPVERPTGGAADPPAPSETGEPLVGVLARLWGELPARLRRQVQQPLVEDFVPNYETITEQYFRRLAEQE